MVVGTFHRDQNWVVNGRANNLAALQVGGYEDDGSYTSARAVGGNAAGQISGGGAGNRCVAKLKGLGRRNGDHPVLEGERRVHAVVLNVEVVKTQLFAKSPSFNKGGESGHYIYRIIAIGWEQVFVTPDAERPLSDAVLADNFRYGGVVVDHF